MLKNQMAINWGNLHNAAANPQAPRSSRERFIEAAKNIINHPLADRLRNMSVNAATSWWENVNPREWGNKDMAWRIGAVAGAGVVVGANVFAPGSGMFRGAAIWGTEQAIFFGIHAAEGQGWAIPHASDVYIKNFFKGVAAGGTYGSLGLGLAVGGAAVYESLSNALGSEVPPVPAIATATETAVKPVAATATAEVRVTPTAEIVAPTTVPTQEAATPVVIATSVPPQAIPVATPTEVPANPPTRAPIAPVSTSTPRPFTPTIVPATETPVTPVFEPSPVVTATPDVRVPLLTPTSPAEVIPDEPIVPTIEPFKPRPTGLLPSIDTGIDTQASAQDPDELMSFKINLKPDEALYPAPSDRVGLNTEKLTQLRDLNVHKMVEMEGAYKYVRGLEAVLSDSNNLEKFNPYDKGLGQVTEEAVEAARKDYLSRLYESARVSDVLAEEAKRLGSVPSNISEVVEVANKEFGEAQGAQAYAGSLNEGEVGANGNSITKGDILAAQDTAQMQYEEAQSAIRNQNLVRGFVNVAPPPSDLIAPEVKLGLPDFFNQEINVKPGSSFWDSWDIPKPYFQNELPNGWINSDNGVTQEDVVKDMIRRFAGENGKSLDNLHQGSFRLDDLGLTEEQKDAIREVLATRTSDQYFQRGLKAFQLALKKAA